MPKVTIELGKKIDVAHVDNSIDVNGVGTLKFSRGTVEWRPYKNSVNLRTFTWTEFAKTLENNGSAAVAKKVATKKVVKKVSTKKVVAKKARGVKPAAVKKTS